MFGRRCVMLVLESSRSSVGLWSMSDSSCSSGSHVW